MTKTDNLLEIKLFSNVEKRIMIVLLHGKGVTSLKLHLLFRTIVMIMLVFVGVHFVSMNHLNQHVSHGNVLAVETDASIATFSLQEDDQKHIDLLKSIQVKEALTLILLVKSLLIFSSSSSKRKIRHFLYAVYFQSSYFSKNHLFTT
jgi:hypothetical protein